LNLQHCVIEELQITTWHSIRNNV